MDENLVKKNFDDMIGEEKLFTEQLHRKIMDQVSHPPKVNRFTFIQRFVPTVILLALIVVGGSYYFLVFSNNNNQEANPDIPLDNNPNIPLEQSGNGKEGDVLQEEPVYLAANENELSELDYEKAYELSARALTDYYYAIRNGIDINLDTFIDNKNLKQYMQKKIEDEFRVDSKVKTIEIVDWEIVFSDDADGGYLYLMLPARIMFNYDGGFGEVHEFLVRNVNGKLVIVDWYNGGKDSYDFLVRGENETIDNPNIWNDQEWVNNLLQKQNGK